jgi:hypothetical protein
MPHGRQIVIGLGTGRCGTQSLAVILNQQGSARVEHERHGPEIAWQGDEARVAAFVRQCAAASELDLVGDIAFYYLPYVEHILALAPDARFVCLKRDRKATVDSYLTWTDGRNHWMRHNGIKWRLDKWDRCYPKYPAADKAEAIGRYWDDYYRRADALESAYPHAFQVFATEWLNSAEGQHTLFDFLGLPAACRRVTLGVRAHQSAPVQAVGFLERCGHLFHHISAGRHAA